VGREGWEGGSVGRGKERRVGGENRLEEVRGTEGEYE